MLSREVIFEKFLGFQQERNVCFEELALDVFRYQANQNQVYKTFLSYLSIDIGEVYNIEQIPFLPVSLFKTREIKSGNWNHEKAFESSSTSSMITSKHYIRNLEFYLLNTKLSFENTYGDIRDYCFMALLPNNLLRMRLKVLSEIHYIF